MCSSSSCRFRKYHGAFDGFGVWFGFAWAVSGALKRIESGREEQQEDRGADCLDHDERWPDHHLVFGEVSWPRQRPAPDQLEQLLAFRLVNCAAGTSPRVCCAISAISPTLAYHVANLAQSKSLVPFAGG